MHLFTSQMVVAFIELHNRLVDRLRDDGSAEQDVFEEARRAATWHYQHVILREFLPGLIGAQLTAELLDDGPQLYRADGDPYIPFEFADAAYRYGHAQIRDRYQVNDALRPVPGVPRPDGLRRRSRPSTPSTGPCRSTSRATPPAQRAKRIDSRLPAAADRAAHPDLRIGAGHRLRVAGHPRPAARPSRRPASGEAVARRLGVPALSAEQVGLAEHGWTGETPLWFYILKEAEVTARRRPAGPGRRPDRRRGAGGHHRRRSRVVPVGRPGWTPTLPRRRAGAFGLADILVPLPA